MLCLSYHILKQALLPTPKEPGIGASATKVVKRLAVCHQWMSQSRRSEKVYTAFTEQQRAAIGKYAECGNAAALRKYQREVPDLGESTVRLFKKRYLEQLRASPDTGVASKFKYGPNW